MPEVAFPPLCKHLNSAADSFVPTRVCFEATMRNTSRHITVADKTENWDNRSGWMLYECRQKIVSKWLQVAANLFHPLQTHQVPEFIWEFERRCISVCVWTIHQMFPLLRIQQSSADCPSLCLILSLVSFTPNAFQIFAQLTVWSIYIPTPSPSTSRFFFFPSRYL